MGILGTATLVDGRTGRQLNNALTLTFKVSQAETLAVATQSAGLGVLLGFRNGGSGRYTLKAGDAALSVDCRAPRTTIALAGGGIVGSIEPSGGVVELREPSGRALGRLAGQPQGRRHDPVWTFPLSSDAGEEIGRILLMRTTFDASAEITDLALWWDRPGGPLKVPTLGVRLELARPVEQPLGDLLLGACVDLALGVRAFTSP